MCFGAETRINIADSAVTARLHQVEGTAVVPIPSNCDRWESVPLEV